MIAKPIDKIEKADIDALVERQVHEKRGIEYKLELPGGSDDEKKEFLADVSSLANAAGGDLFYGVQAADGVPIKAEGVTLESLDAVKLRLENIIRDGVEPRIPGVQIEGVSGFSRGPVLVLRVPQSWSSPHMVTFKRCSRFFTRNSAGKYQMNVTEIRSAFARSGTVAERIRLFRDQRLARIVAGETPVPMQDGPRAVLHVVPVAGFTIDYRLDLSVAHRNQRLLTPPGSSGWSCRFNLDGVCTYAEMASAGLCFSYCQAFRNGAIEALDGCGMDDASQKLIPITGLECDLIQSMHFYLDFLRAVQAPFPLVLSFGVLGVKNATIAAGSYHAPRRAGIRVDRDMLVLPEIFVEDESKPPQTLLKPLFDAVWNAAGWPGSLNYDEDGNWRQHD